MCLRNDFLVCGTRTLLSYLLIVHHGLFAPSLFFNQLRHTIVLQY